MEDGGGRFHAHQLDKKRIEIHFDIYTADSHYTFRHMPETKAMEERRIHELIKSFSQIYIEAKNKKYEQSLWKTAARLVVG